MSNITVTDTVPEHDEDHPVTSATPTVPEAPANPDTDQQGEVTAPAAPVAQLAPAPRAGNAAWASEEDRNTIAQLHAAIRAAGYTRPMIIKATGFSDSRVYLAQHAKAQYHEVGAWLEYFKSLPRDDDGNFLPAPGSKVAKPKVEDVQRELTEVRAELQTRIDEAVATLSTEDAKTVKQLREVVQAARDALLGVRAPAEESTEADATA